MKPKIKIDQEAKILSIRLSNKKSVDSEIKGNIVIDLSKNGEIVNIDIMKFSLEDFDRKLNILKSFPNLVIAK